MNGINIPFNFDDLSSYTAPLSGPVLAMTSDDIPVLLPANTINPAVITSKPPFDTAAGLTYVSGGDYKGHAFYIEESTLGGAENETFYWDVAYDDYPNPGDSFPDSWEFFNTATGAYWKREGY